MDTNQPEDQINKQFQQQFGGGAQQDVPNATAALILGICSIVFCGLGPILGTIGLVLSGNGKKAYEANPSFYKEASFKNLKAGRTCATIGLIIGSLIWLFYIIMFIVAFAFGGHF
ncbi:MAG: CCC motif membrane protein [Bacteroidota bacterium]|nr:CCC motif membrane protein [Bacteroidota bacterium]